MFHYLRKGASFIGALGTIVQVTLSGYFTINGKRFYPLATAITDNTTETTAPAGSFAFTTNATGRGEFFVADGAKWQSLKVS